MTNKRNLTERAFAAAFTEWERRYREEPAKFASDFERFTASAKTYGDSASAYFISVLDELSGGQPWITIPDGGANA
jgi:hypothetical protein